MGATAAVHPAEETLQSYGLGELDDASTESVNQHLKSCPGCQRRVAELSADISLGQRQAAEGSPELSAADRSQLGVPHIDVGATVAVAPPPPDGLPPELVDHPDYEIVRELGRGGMGVVYLAQNKLMGRQEVLKVVGSHLVERPGVLERFLREIRSAAKLQHRNIVTAYSAMRLGPSVVLTMEYVEGLDLAKLVKTKGPLPIAHACSFIHQAALGLQHAHERGMVHRDIKPANLILASDGKKAVVKVLDFGLAKVSSEGQTDSGLTREGQMLGTPDYIAPEQIRDAQSADIRADIYSLGCTFYCLLTGGPPFRGDHLWDLYQAHFSMEASPLNAVRADVPVELAALVGKMLAKSPAERFQTPGEVARALTPFFKPASMLSAGSSAEMPRFNPAVAAAQNPGAGLAPTQPATDGSAAAATRRDPSTVVAESLAWERLIEVEETEPSIVPPKPTPESNPPPATAPVRRLPWASRKMIAAACVLGFIALCAVIYIAIDSRSVKVGHVKIEVPVAKLEREPLDAGPSSNGADSGGLDDVGFGVARNSEIKTEGADRLSSRTLESRAQPSAVEPAVPLDKNAQAPPAAADSDRAAATGAKVSANPAAAEPPVSTAADSPEEQLKARGLTRSGSYFVLASETEALEKYRQIRILIDQMVQAYGKHAQIVQNEILLAEAVENHEVMRSEFDAANAVLSKIPNGPKANSQQKQQHEAQRLYRDGVARQRDAYREAAAALRGQQAPAGVKEGLQREFAATRLDFLKMAPQVTQLLEKAKAEHRKVQDDPAVKVFLAAIGRATNTRVALSPAKNLQNAIDAIKKAARASSPPTNSPRKRRQGARR